MSEMKHTSEPWIYQEGSKTIRSKKQNYWIASMNSWDNAVDNEANAARIVACVNACKNVPNEWLQENSIKARIQEISLLKKQNQILIDTIMAIVEEGIDELSISQLREAVDHCKKISL